MNIDDVKKVQRPADGSFVATIFTHQFELFVKYYDIEMKNGFYKPRVVKVAGGPMHRPHLDDPQFQNWIKGMFWRVTEELAEALEPIENKGVPFEWTEVWEHDPEIRHFFEELADALHFLAEVTVILDRFDPKDIQTRWRELEQSVTARRDGTPYAKLLRLSMKVVSEMGLAANTLKNKPWKNTQMPTDEIKFNAHLASAWVAIITLFLECNCGLASVFDLYFKKNQVNQFRQRTNY